MFNCIIIQTGNQIDAQHKSATAISIPLRQYPKDFQVPDDMFNHHALSSQLLVELFLLLGQLAAFRFLERRSRLFVQLKYSLITTIGKAFHCFRQCRLAMLIERKIVPRSLGKPCVNNLPRILANSQLGFYRVPLFLARIVSFLFFFGRSIGDSARVHDDHFDVWQVFLESLAGQSKFFGAA